MNFFVTGLDLTERAELFQALQNPDKSQLSSYMRKLRESFDYPQLFLLTCDRFEIYTENKPYPAEKAERILSLNPLVVKKYRYSISGDDVISHLFWLSSGIISPLFGEDTIISQLITSSELARQEGVHSSRLEKLFNMAIAFGKKCQSTMRLRQYESSIGDAMEEAVSDKGKVLVVGSGEWARNIAAKLSESHSVSMTLRDEEKIFLLPPSVKSIAYENRRAAAREAEAIISASSGLYYTFDEDDRSLFDSKLLIDLASPPDIPRSLNPITLESLGVVLEKRLENIDRVKKAAECEVKDYQKWLSSSESAESVYSEAIDLANDVIRRLSSPISALEVEEGKKKSLQDAIYETVRKAYIGSVLSRKQ